MKGENGYMLVPADIILDWIEEKIKLNKIALETLYQKWSITSEDAKRDILYDIINRHKLILETLKAIRVRGDSE